ncbi:hypothetical protein Q1695_008328 [Nippostrongylus brasiliensis]|nr:hypothetical protein Q1695_008328 [Nippostrongylus brasiliensis]
MPQRRISWRERRTATPAERDDEHEPPIRHAKSAGCSPLVHRKLKFLGCAGTSFESSYHLDSLAEVGEIVAEMSPRSRRSRLQKIFESLTPSKLVLRCLFR